MLEQRLRDALARLNPDLPAEALEDAFRKLTRPEGAEPVARNRGMHRLLVDGVTVEYRTADGDIRRLSASTIPPPGPAKRGVAIDVAHVFADQSRHAPRGLVGDAKLALQFLRGDAVPGSGEQVHDL